MKKLTLLAFIALSLFAAKTVNKADNPFPTCEPLPLGPLVTEDNIPDTGQSVTIEVKHDR